MSQYSDQCKCGVCDEVRRLRDELAAYRELSMDAASALRALARIPAWDVGRGLPVRAIRSAAYVLRQLTACVKPEPEPERCGADMGCVAYGSHCELPKHHAGVHRCAKPDPVRFERELSQCQSFIQQTGIMCELREGHDGQHRCCQVQW